MKEYTEKEIKQAFYKTLESLSNLTWKKCFKDKMSVEDVSEKDWQESSKSFDELWQDFKKLLKVAK